MLLTIRRARSSRTPRPARALFLLCERRRCPWLSAAWLAHPAVVHAATYTSKTSRFRSPQPLTRPLYRARSRPPKGPLRPPRFTASRSESFDPSPYLGRASRLRLMRVQENRACWTPVPTNEPYSLTCSVQERNGLGCW